MSYILKSFVGVFIFILLISSCSKPKILCRYQKIKYGIIASKKYVHIDGYTTTTYVYFMGFNRPFTTYFYAQEYGEITIRYYNNGKADSFTISRNKACYDTLEIGSNYKIIKECCLFTNQFGDIMYMGRETF